MYSQNWNNCVRCAQLCQVRENVVLGYGNPNAQVMFVADKPDHEDDSYGVPLGGDLGLFFNETLKKCGMRREDVWVTHAVACHAGEHRASFNQEIDACKERLLEEILGVDPDIIVLMGKEAVLSLVGVRTPIAKMQLRTFNIAVRGAMYPAIVTYAPWQIRKTPSQKRGQPWHFMYRAFARAAKVASILNKLRGNNNE